MFTHAAKLHFHKPKKSVLPDDVLNQLNRTNEYLYRLYKEDNRPWVVAYSGGKDSTLLLQLVYELLMELGTEAKKPVYIVSTDTKVEAPNVSDYVAKTLQLIESNSRAAGLPIFTRLSHPTPDEGYWGKVIGKGYPPPTRWFRWCTSNMKIKPAKRAIEAVTQEFGSVILLLGTRLDESASREKRMKERQSNEFGLNPHHEIPNALVATPIADWATDDVWEYLFAQNPAPWGSSHDFMLSLYRQANGGECPIVLDLNTPSCGGSRFGCWTCTVVKQDKSMDGFIQSGEEWMRPLSEFRNWLKVIREDAALRMKYKRNNSEGIGPFTPDARKMILRKLLETERTVQRELIDDADLAYIQIQWTTDFDVAGNAAARIAAEFDRKVMTMIQPPLPDADQQIVEKLIETHELPQELIDKLLSLANHQYASLEARGAKAGFERDIEQAIKNAVKQADEADPTDEI
jgi:DNA sulfur modification protein DndC